MSRRNVDLLILCSNSKFWSGYLRYFTNCLADMYPEYLLLTADGEMTYFAHYTPFADIVRHGFGVDAFAVPTNVTRSYAIDATKICEHIKKNTPASIGVVGYDTLSAAFYERLLKELPNTSIGDATDLMNDLRIVKSPEEIRLIEKSAEITDIGWEACLTAVKPGRREYDVVVDVAHAVMQAGSEEQFFTAGSAPAGVNLPMYPINMLKRTLEKGDVFRILIELSGPGGCYTEVLRLVSLGPIPRKTEEIFNACLEAQREAAKKLRPGVSYAEVHNAAQNVLGRIGKSALNGLLGHGQGFDVVEPPMVHPDEARQVQAGSNIAIHPLVYICDNFLVEEHGARRLQKTPQEIFTV